MEDIIIISTKSTFLNEAAPTTNYGNNTPIYLGISSNYHWDDLIEFDLTTCPPASSIKTALFYLNCLSVTGTGGTGTVKRCTASWVEATVTWGTKPANTGDYGITNLTATGARSVDITTLVKEWKAGTYNNYGIYLSATSTNGNSSGFGSDDYATEAERPRLVITPSVPSGGILNWFFSEAWRKHDKLWQPKLILPKEEYSY